MKSRPKNARCFAKAGGAARLSMDRQRVRDSELQLTRILSKTGRFVVWSGTIVLRQSMAFSLLELLVVVAIMVILTTMYWGSGSGARQKKLQADCQNNLQKSYIALQIFAKDHGDKFPEAPGARTSEEPLDALVPRYTSDTAVFICPASKDSGLPSAESIRKRKISYAYYMGRRLVDAQEALLSDKQVDTQSKVAGQPVFSSTGKPPGNNHGKAGGNFMFCDGHVQSAPATAPFSLVLTQGVVLLNPKP